MKSTSLKLISVILTISIFMLSCTLPFYFGTAEPEEKIVYVEVTVTPENPADTTEDTSEAAEGAPAATPTVSVSLDGDWTIWYGVDEDELSLSFLQQGYSLIANVATGGDDSLLFTGVINQDGSGVEGTWESTDGTEGHFIMTLGSGLSTYTGNMGGGVAFCGARGSAVKPSTCLK